MGSICSTEELYRHNQKDGKGRTIQPEGSVKLEQGILRCQGRYQNAELTQGAKCPKLLPRKEHYTQLVIQDSHYNVLHAGVSQTLAEARQSYWIPKERSEARKVLSLVLNNCKVYQQTEGGPFKMPKRKGYAVYSF